MAQIEVLKASLAVEDGCSAQSSSATKSDQIASDWASENPCITVDLEGMFPAESLVEEGAPTHSSEDSLWSDFLNLDYAFDLLQSSETVMETLMAEDMKKQELRPARSASNPSEEPFVSEMLPTSNFVNNTLVTSAANHSNLPTEGMNDMFPSDPSWDTKIPELSSVDELGEQGVDYYPPIHGSLTRNALQIQRQSINNASEEDGGGSRTPGCSWYKTLPSPPMSHHDQSTGHRSSHPFRKLDSDRKTPSFSPFINTLIGYSPAHRENIKCALRNSPAYGYAQGRTNIYEATGSSYSTAPTGNGQCILLEILPEDVGGRLPGTFPQRSGMNSLQHHVGCELRFERTFTSQTYCPQCQTRFLCSGDPSDQPNLEEMCDSASNELVRRLDRFGNTSLHLVAASPNGSIRALMALLQRHPNINAINTAGQTFMHVLNGRRYSCLGLRSVFETLQALDFNFDQRDVEGNTFARVLTEQDVDSKLLEPYSNSVLMLDNTGMFQTPNGRIREMFHGVIGDHNGEFIETMLSGSSLTSLSATARIEDQHQYDGSGRPAVTRYLAETGDAFINFSSEIFNAFKESFEARDKHGYSPLHHSIGRGNIEATKILLQNGANVHARTWTGDGVLETADSLYFWKESERYAKIEACRALAIDAGAKQHPTLFDEWDMPLK